MSQKKNRTRDTNKTIHINSKRGQKVRVFLCELTNIRKRSYLLIQKSKISKVQVNLSTLMCEQLVIKTYMSFHAL